MKYFRYFLTFFLVFLCTNLYAKEHIKVPLHDLRSLPEKPTYVDMSVYLNNILKIDKQINEQPKIYLNISLRTKWQDSRLKYRYMKGDNSIKIYHDQEAEKLLKTIWIPDIYVPQAEQKTKHTKLSIFPSGVLILDKEIELTIPLHLKLRLFPFDTQKINIRFVPEKWENKEVIFEENNIMTGYDNNIKLAQWTVDMVFTSIGTWTDSRFALLQPSFDLIIYIKRIPSFYIYRVIVPLFFIIMVVCLCFLAFNEPTGTRLSRAVVFLLITVAFHSLASSFLPNINYLTFIDTIILLSYFLVLAAIIQILVLHILRFYNRNEIALHLEYRFALYGPLLFIVALIVMVLYYFLSY